MSRTQKSVAGAVSHYSEKKPQLVFILVVSSGSRGQKVVRGAPAVTATFHQRQFGHHRSSAKSVQAGWALSSMREVSGDLADACM